MPGATMTTGSISLDTNADVKTKQGGQDGGDACHFVVLGDFSGRGQRGLSDLSSLHERRVIEIDRDNFDEVFESLKVQCHLPLADGPIKFSELDDMHPDVIYEHVPLFNKFRVLKKKLNDRSKFKEAAEEIYQWGKAAAQADVPSNSVTEIDSKEGGSFLKGSLLDNILGDSQTGAPTNEGMDIQALVKDIVAPYVEPKPDPQVKELTKTVDDSTSHLMRKLIHHPNFQSIESVWRSLYLLVRRIETDRKLKVFIVDVSEQEVLDDAAQASDYEQSQLNKLLNVKRSSIGDTPFSAIVVDQSFGHDEDDLSALDLFGQIAHSTGAMLIAGASEKLGGCEHLATTPDKEDWSYNNNALSEKWEALRRTPYASNIFAMAPRFLVRMPYGKKSSPIESFPFEELPLMNRHEFYLWGNSAFLLSILLAQAYSQNGDMTQLVSQEIDRLPLHVFDDDGESAVTPCAEINMYDPAALALREAGLSLVRTILNKDAVLLTDIAPIKKGD